MCSSDSREKPHAVFCGSKGLPSRDSLQQVRAARGSGQSSSLPGCRVPNKHCDAFRPQHSRVHCDKNNTPDKGFVGGVAVY